MKKQLHFSLIYYVLFLFAFATVLGSCEKIPGHSVVPSGGSGSSSSGGGGGTSGSTAGGGSSGGSTTGCITPSGATPNINGIGPVAIGATNTISYQVNNGTVYTVPASYPITANFKSNGGIAGGPFTDIEAIDATTGNKFYIEYNSLSTGIVNAYLCTLSIPPYDMLSSVAFGFGSEKFNITTSNITGDTSGSGSSTGTVKGTFDGYMVDNCFNQVRVSGSFNFSK